MSFSAGDWCHSLDHSEPCRVIAVEDLWGIPTAQVWLSRRDAVVRLPVARLQTLEQASPTSLEQLSFVAAAARILDAFEHDALVAPLEGSVIPLPHQLQALQRAMSGDRVRYLLADEVGLGKTIEAGLIIRELKVRGLAKRVLVVAPAGLVNQWVSELDTHFNETFHLVQPGNFAAWRQLLGVGPDENLWKQHNQVVCTLDSVKPMDSRRGWSPEQVARYNRERFDDLVNAGWDLVVIDEAHRLGGSTETVARFRLGEGLAQASPYLLLLSATPHQGKTDAFRRLLCFLDPDALPDNSSVTRENVAPYVIRTEKRRAINDKGEPLFQPRHTQLVSVAWDSARLEQRVLYDAVTEYVREGYNQALRDKQPAIGFLMILMQRLVTSSTAAIRTALERRLQVLELPTGQLSLFGEDVGDDWAELEGQEQLETLLNSRLKELKNERAEVELLLSAARRCEARGIDVKAQALLDTIQQLQREENDLALKVLLFTEFVPTQQMLAEVLEQRGYPVVVLNGSMNLEERKSAQRAFANEAQILISTDAGGEGLNLQFCHVIINYDLPWNPMKLEQRIGRVDRIGQAHVVRALNFALEDTVELRVREVLEEKLERILKEFGVDKLSDVLDSEENGLDFHQLYVNAVLTPEEAEARAAALAEAIRARALSAHEGASLLSSFEELDPKAAQRVAGHLMPFWTERMTLSWLQTQAEAGGQVRPNPAGGLDLHWPDGHRDLRATFSRQSAKEAGLLHLSLEEPRLRALTAALPPRAPGMTVPVLHLPELVGKVYGIWSLWRVAVQTSEGRSQRLLPLFLSSEGKLLEPTARLIWERLISLDGELQLLPGSQLSSVEAAQAYDRSHQQAQQQGRPLFDELQAKHKQRLERERRKQELAFAARQRVIEQLGLPQVRDFRRAQLQQEEQQWRQEFQRRQETLPSLTLLLLVSLAPASA